ncbi:MAG: hypothetical protein ACLFVT_10125 [Syntrophobacteria bacterium]
MNKSYNLMYVPYYAVDFYKFAGEGEKYATRAEKWHLAPEIRELWQVMEKINRKLEDRR